MSDAAAVSAVIQAALGMAKKASPGLTSRDATRPLGPTAAACLPTSTPALPSQAGRASALAAAVAAAALQGVLAGRGPALSCCV